MKKAKDIMSRNPVTCRVNDSVLDAAKVMKKENTGVVPIVDEQDRCVGVITDRDICLRVVVENKDPGMTRLNQVVSEDLLTCRVEEDLEDILRNMERKQVKRIVVVDDNNCCVGIISEHDIVRKVKDPEKVAELAGSIYR